MFRTDYDKTLLATSSFLGHTPLLAPSCDNRRPPKREASEPSNMSRSGVTTTIVVPNYNHARFLPTSLGGVLGQAHRADEIIIVDDASTDTSLEVIDRLVAGRPEVRVERLKTNGGATAALNRGLSISRGDFIAFLGADDRVLPHFLAETTELLEANPGAGFACGRVSLIDGDDRKFGERPIIQPITSKRYVPPAEARGQLCFADNFFLGAATLYRRTALMELGGFNPALGALCDGILQRRIAVRFGYAYLPELLAFWRIHGANYSVTSTTDVKSLEHNIAVAKAVFEAEPPGLFPDGYATLFERRLRFNAARLLIEGLEPSAQSAQNIAAAIAGHSIDVHALQAFAKLKGAFRPMALSWITLRLKPFAWSWLLGEASTRAFRKLSPRPVS
jgi:glycosyltransferase involved in cell wall biosynthesis